MSNQVTTQKLALITGGQRGIGLGIALELANKGYDIAISARSDRDHEDVIAALDAIRSTGVRAEHFPHDISNLEAVPALLDQIEAELGPVTSFVSNAGVPAKIRGDMLEMLPENFDFVMDINLKGNFFLAQEIAKRMLSLSDDIYKSMIFVTSVSSAMVSIERAEYCMSKAGAAMMVKLFAHRLAEAGIGVFEVRPGIIQTGMTAGVKDKYDALIEGGLVPQKRWGQPEDIGQIIVPLTEGNMGFASGSVIDADGGLSIHRL